MNAMKTELSPVALTVLATYEKVWGQGYGSPLAAALRETVNQLKFLGITEKNILAIAAELENQS